MYRMMRVPTLMYTATYVHGWRVDKTVIKDGTYLMMSSCPRSTVVDSTFSYLQLILSLLFCVVVVVVISPPPPPPDVLLIDFRPLLHFQGEMAKLLLVTPPLTLSAVVTCRVVDWR